MKKLKIIQFLLLIRSILSIPVTTPSAQIWTPVPALNNTWEGADAFADGHKLFAVGLYWSLAVATTQTPAAPGPPIPNLKLAAISYVADWTSIACSADGNTLAAINFNTY